MSKPKSKTWWLISSGHLWLPFTARTTRREAVNARLKQIREDELPDYEHIVRVRVTEIPKGGRP